MEQHLITKYKLKNNGPPVKVCLYMDEHCEWNVFIKRWSDFAARLTLHVDDAMVFTPKDDDFKVDVFRKETLCSNIFSCRKHREGPYADPRR
jgi:hypothetical protein